MRRTSALALLLPLFSALPAEEEEQTLQPLGHLQPKQLPACSAALAESRKDLDSIASLLGVENKLSDLWEGQLLFRQSQGLQASNGREVRTSSEKLVSDPPCSLRHRLRHGSSSKYCAIRKRLAHGLEFVRYAGGL